MGNGAIHEAIAGLEIGNIDARIIAQSAENVKERIEIEVERVNNLCAISMKNADYEYSIAEDISSIQMTINNTTRAIASLNRAVNTAATIAGLSKCSIGTSSDCAAGAVALGVYTGVQAGISASIELSEGIIGKKEQEIGELNRQQILFHADVECERYKADSEASVANLTLELSTLELEALKADYHLRLAFSQISRLRQQAARIEAEQSESEQLAINIEAARNDPNVRIYRNDAVINADIAFKIAIANAYRATKVFEYYTSQSYARLDELSLIRLVARGDYNLENYLVNLEEAYYDFLELVGRPDQRIDILSLKDDILGIPRYAESGKILGEAERVAMFRNELADPRWRDPNGQLSFPFQTVLTRLSPLTRNHKIGRIETEIIGSDVGDTVARVYLTLAGTGTVHTLSDERVFYRFPERTAVVNAFLNGVRVFSPEIYHNERLRDRPYANTNWLLRFSQDDEMVNRDVSLNSLTDIRVYVYYSDFTEL